MESTTLHILVVDDEPDLETLVRMKFRRQIRQGDFTFAFAADGVEALETLDSNPDIDLVLTDINMPRMDGLTLLTRMSALDRSIKAVVVSAYGDMDNIRKAMNQGAFDFLVKPVDLDDLSITVEKAQATLVQQKQAQQVRDAFGRYLSDEVVAALLEHPEGLKLGGEKRTVTLLMSDLRGFSTLSAALSPERVVEILNIYLGRMADVITGYKGTIDEFIGDAILVIFGAPVQRDDDAVRALACALAMQQAMDDVNAEMEARGLPPLEMGIGVHTGEVVVGNIGSPRRAKYGVVGSPVNLTARIESYTVGGQVLTTEATLEAAGPEAQIDREMQLTAKGFSEPIHIYAVESVGAPYHLSLPVRVEQLTLLDQPWPLRITPLDGKYMTNSAYDGTITRLASSGAQVQTEATLGTLDNLKIVLLSIDGGEPLGDLYAKVVSVSEAGYKVRFTAVPAEVAAIIAHADVSS